MLSCPSLVKGISSKVCQSKADNFIVRIVDTVT